MDNEDQKLPRTSLSDFVLTEGEIERAMEYPLLDEIRKELRLLPDVHKRKPRLMRRIVATGIEAWGQRGDTSFGLLMQKLLYLYFTGQLHIGDVPAKNPGRFALEEASEEDDEEFDDDFNFVER